MKIDRLRDKDTRRNVVLKDPYHKDWDHSVQLTTNVKVTSRVWMFRFLNNRAFFVWNYI